MDRGLPYPAGTDLPGENRAGISKPIATCLSDPASHAGFSAVRAEKSWSRTGYAVVPTTWTASDTVRRLPYLMKHPRKSDLAQPLYEVRFELTKNHSRREATGARRTVQSVVDF